MFALLVFVLTLILLCGDVGCECDVVGCRYECDVVDCCDTVRVIMTADVSIIVVVRGVAVGVFC